MLPVTPPMVAALSGLRARHENRSSTSSSALRRMSAEAAIAEWRRRVRSRRDLMALNERELLDVRLTRLARLSHHVFE